MSNLPFTAAHQILPVALMSCPQHRVLHKKFSVIPQHWVFIAYPLCFISEANPTVDPVLVGAGQGAAVRTTSQGTGTKGTEAAGSSEVEQTAVEVEEGGQGGGGVLGWKNDEELEALLDMVDMEIEGASWASRPL